MTLTVRDQCGAGSTNRRRLHAARVVIVAAAFAVPPASGDIVRLELSTPHETLSRNEPVVADLTVRNVSGRPAYLELHRMGHDYVNVRVRDPAGNTTYVRSDDLRTCVDDCLHSPLGPVLAVDETQRVFLALNRWFTFVETGTYEVAVDLQRSAVVDMFEHRADQVEVLRDGTPFLTISAEDRAWLEEPIATSNTLSISVGKRDEVQLRARADEMLQAVADGDGRGLEALIHMRDPVGVAALESVGLSGHAGWRDAIKAIGRIGTVEAVYALRRLRRSGNTEVKAHAVTALTRVASVHSSSDLDARLLAEEELDG